MYIYKKKIHCSYVFYSYVYIHTSASFTLNIDLLFIIVVGNYSKNAFINHAAPLYILVWFICAMWIYMRIFGFQQYKSRQHQKWYHHQKSMSKESIKYIHAFINPHKHNILDGKNHNLDVRFFRQKNNII